MRSIKLQGSFFSLLLLSALFLAACSDKKKGVEFSFEHSIQEAVIEKRCVQGATHSECYLLKWRVPVEVEGLLRTHVWLDTTVIDTAAQEVSEQAKSLSLKKEWNPSVGGAFDSLDISAEVLALLSQENGKSFDTLEISLWAEYEKASVPGKIIRTFAILGDDLKPSRILLADSGSFKEISVRWTRPIDQTDYYRPDSINGVIHGYNINFWSDKSVDISKVRVSLRIGGVESTDRIHMHARWRNLGSSLELFKFEESSLSELHLAITDGIGFQGDSTDQFRLLFSGLPPETKFNLSVTTYDRVGNSENSATTQVATTDSIPPLRPESLWVAMDSFDSGKVRLDSNRVFVYWPASLDPLPASACLEPPCSRPVATYQLERFVNGVWSDLHDGLTVSLRTWTLENQVMRPSDAGLFWGDTIKWIVPGDSVILRLRAVDSSGAVSAWLRDTLRVGHASRASQIQCPSGYASIGRKNADSSFAYFCMERSEHLSPDSTKVAHNVLFSKARAVCQQQQADGFRFDLCEEYDWASACVAGKSSFGTIQESPFDPEVFLPRYCNVGTSDAAQALNPEARSSRCVSSDGVYDLPGQLQEWTRGTRKILDTLPSGKIDTLTDSVGVLKGSSYVAFTGVGSLSTLAACGVRAYPVRYRKNYTLDTVFLYQNKTQMDTLVSRDTTRTLYKVLPPGSYRDTLIFFDVYDETGESYLGEDYVEHSEFLRRGGQVFIDAIAAGLVYKNSRPTGVRLLPGVRSLPGSERFYRDPSIGFRCCAYAQ